MADYPILKRFAVWLGSSLIPGLILGTVCFAIGFDKGEARGRLEMKCAILGVVEKLGDGKPAPGTITLGCEKR